MFLSGIRGGLGKEGVGGGQICRSWFWGEVLSAVGIDGLLIYARCREGNAAVWARTRARNLTTRRCGCDAGAYRKLLTKIQLPT